jgi:nicotinamide phosphoribosyltransferase
MSIFEFRNIINAADCYKFSHPFVISKSVDGLTAYIEARHGWADEVVFFGLQAYIREYLSKPITFEDIDLEEQIAKSALIPFHREMWDHIVTNYNGFLPVKIQALPEGTPVKHGIPVVQIISTDRKFPGIISVIETSLLRAVWYPSSVATLSREIKKNLRDFIIATSDVPAETLLPTMLNDFGARGTSSGESAALGGLGHALNFIGSDTVEAIHAAITYYDHSLTRHGPVIISVPATEHSVTTMNGEAGECKFVGDTIDTFTKAGFPIISLVADSYDLDRFVSEYIGTVHKEKIEARDGFIVVRPDSGEPTQIVPHVIKLLWEKFGGTHNSKGFKILNPKVRVIQGDGVNRHSISAILEHVMAAGFSVENLVFGMGGQLLQGPMRDDQSWAMKTNAVHFRARDPNEELAGALPWHDVQKKPKTDPTKASKAGRQAVVFYEGNYHSVREDALGIGSHGTHNFLETVWDSGKTIRTTNFIECRKRAEI